MIGCIVHRLLKVFFVSLHPFSKILFKFLVGIICTVVELINTQNVINNNNYCLFRGVITFLKTALVLPPLYLI